MMLIFREVRNLHTEQLIVVTNTYSDIESKATLFSGFDCNLDRQMRLAASCCDWIRVGR